MYVSGWMKVKSLVREEQVNENRVERVYKVWFPVKTPKETNGVVTWMLKLTGYVSDPNWFKLLGNYVVGNFRIIWSGSKSIMLEADLTDIGIRFAAQNAKDNIVQSEYTTNESTDEVTDNNVVYIEHSKNNKVSEAVNVNNDSKPSPIAEEISELESFLRNI